jgi:hypothetical protein
VKIYLLRGLSAAADPILVMWLSAADTGSILRGFYAAADTILVHHYLERYSHLHMGSCNSGDLCRVGKTQAHVGNFHPHTRSD